MSSASTGSPQHRVTRAQANASRTACTVCHQRKVKCDAQDTGFPCSNCRKTNREDECHIHQKRKRISRLARLQRQQTAHVLSTPLSLGSPTATVSSIQQFGTPEHDETSASPGGRPESRAAPIFSPLNERRSVTDDASTIGIPGLHTGHPNDGDYKKYLVEFMDQPQITERPIDKDARIMFIGNDFSNIHFLLNQQFGWRTAETSHYPTNRIARQYTCHEPDRLPVEAFQLPPKPVVDRLLGAYFTHINPGFPVVDEDLFMGQYRAKDPQNPPSLLLLHAILVAGAHVLYEQPERETYKAMFFRRAKALFDARFERNRDTIIQAALLLTWHADGPEDVAANAWFWLGLAIRTAIGLGLHMDAEKSNLVPHNKRMWRRVWWLLFQCDVLLALQYGRPQSIRLEDCDVQRVKPTDFQDCGPRVRIDHVIHTTELCIVISNAMRSRLQGRDNPEAWQLALQQTDGALANWSFHLPAELHLHTSPGLDVWTAVLQLHYHTALILLHRPRPNKFATKTSPEDVDICATAATSIQQIFQFLCEKDEIKVLWTSSINCLFTALIQLAVEIRMSNPVLAVSALRKFDSALFSFRRLADYWPNAQSILHFFENSMRQQQVGVSTFERQTDQPDSLQSPTTYTQPVDGATTKVPQNIAQDQEFQDIPASNHQRTDEIADEDNQILSALQRPSSVMGRLTRMDGPELLESWQEWQQLYWQQPESTEDFLFTF